MKKTVGEKALLFQSNKFSTTEKLSCGVTQGSVLVPLLFLVDINGLPNIQQLSEGMVHVDTTEFKTEKDLELI